jgi:hypothetical protein
VEAERERGVSDYHLFIVAVIVLTALSLALVVCALMSLASHGEKVLNKCCFSALDGAKI